MELANEIFGPPWKKKSHKTEPNGTCNEQLFMQWDDSHKLFAIWDSYKPSDAWKFYKFNSYHRDNTLLPITEIIYIYREKGTKSTNMLCWQYANYHFNVKAGGTYTNHSVLWGAQLKFTSYFTLYIHMEICWISFGDGQTTHILHIFRTACVQGRALNAYMRLAASALMFAWQWTMHGWQHRQLSDVLRFILQRCHYFKWNCKMAGKWFGMKRLYPNQGIPIFTLNARTKLWKPSQENQHLVQGENRKPLKNGLSDTAKANCSKHLVFTATGTDLHKLVVLWTCFGDRHQDFYNDWDHNATTSRPDELNIWPKKKPGVYVLLTMHKSMTFPLFSDLTGDSYKLQRTFLQQLQF